MKKCIAILLAGMMILSAGCSKSKETTTEKTTTTATETTTEEPTETEDASDILTGKFDVDVHDASAGEFSIIKALKPKNIIIQELLKKDDGLKAINDQILAGKKTTIRISLTAKSDSKLTMYIMPASDNYRWKISEALASQTVDIKAADTEAEFTVDIPEGIETSKYDFIFVEDGEVIGITKLDILKNADDAKPF